MNNTQKVNEIISNLNLLKLRLDELENSSDEDVETLFSISQPDSDLRELSIKEKKDELKDFYNWYFLSMVKETIKK